LCTHPKLKPQKAGQRTRLGVVAEALDAHVVVHDWRHLLVVGAEEVGRELYRAALARGRLGALRDLDVRRREALQQRSNFILLLSFVSERSDSVSVCA
jgi:hypothetical protein